MIVYLAELATDRSNRCMRGIAMEHSPPDDTPRWRRLSRRSVALIVVLTAAMTVRVPLAHAAHLQSKNSVDGREIRYGIIKGSPYQPYMKFAVKAWNAGDCINIAPDKVTTIEDLTYGVGAYGITGWDGKWTPKVGADQIRVNQSYTSNYPAYKIEGVFTHETGHALGIGDHSAKWGNIIMAGTTPDRGKTTKPKAHDKVDYEKKWGNCW